MSGSLLYNVRGAVLFFFFSSRRRHTRYWRDWSSDVCSSDLGQVARTWEVVDRLDQVVQTLTDSLHDELSPAGVERQLAEVRAESAQQAAAAQDRKSVV